MYEMSYSETPTATDLLDAKATMDEILRANRIDIQNFERDRIANHKKLWKYGYRVAEVNMSQVARIVKSDYRCYSAGIFKDGVAKNENWQYQDLIIFDVDDGLMLQEALEKFGDYDGIIATTRSHQKPKNGVVADRYRVILPLKERIFCTPEDYKEVMANIFKAYPFVDEACKDPSRIYFGNSDAQIYGLGGDRLFDFYAYAEKIKKIKELQKWRDEQERKLQAAPMRSADTRFLQDGTRKSWYESNWLTDVMREKLKHHERFYAGNRNNYLYSVAAFLKNDLGFEGERVKEAILWLNDGELPQREIEKTIFRSLRL